MPSIHARFTTCDHTDVNSLAKEDARTLVYMSTTKDRPLSGTLKGQASAEVLIERRLPSLMRALARRPPEAFFVTRPPKVLDR